MLTTKGWKRFLWEGDLKFSLFSSNGRRYIRRRNGPTSGLRDSALAAGSREVLNPGQIAPVVLAVRTFLEFLLTLRKYGRILLERDEGHLPRSYIP